MQEKSIPNTEKSNHQSPSLARAQTKVDGVSTEHLLGTLRLNLTQPECSDGGRNM